MISKEIEAHLDTITKARVTIKTAERYSDVLSTVVSILCRNHKKSTEKVHNLEQEIETKEQNIVEIKV